MTKYIFMIFFSVYKKRNPDNILWQKRTTNSTNTEKQLPVLQLFLLDLDVAFYLRLYLTTILLSTLCVSNIGKIKQSK